MIRYKYVTKGKLNKDDLEGLNRLYKEETDLKMVLQSETKNRLSVYGRKNKFRLVDIGKFNPQECKRKYNFILAQDRKDTLLGYLCFEHIKMSIEDDIKDLIIVRHMYVSNAANHTNIDYVMFWMLENIVEKCVVFSDKLYRPCNQFEGYCLMTDPFHIDYSKAIRFKRSPTYPVYVNADLKATMYSLGSFEKYANLRKI